MVQSADLCLVFVIVAIVYVSDTLPTLYARILHLISALYYRLL